MNRFILLPCIEHKDEESGNDIPLVSLASKMDDDAFLFFPVSKENASVLNFLLYKNNRKKINVNQDVLGVYKTMIDSFKSGDRKISGIVLDAKYDFEIKEDIIDAVIVVVDSNGMLDNVVKTNFLHAMMVAAIEEMEVYVTDALFLKLKPKEDFEKMANNDDENDDNDDENTDSEPEPPKNGLDIIKNFPIDEKIINIAKKIMDGKIEDK